MENDRKNLPWDFEKCPGLFCFALLVTCSESWYQKLEFCVTSIWFYYHEFWWSSWRAMLALILLDVFLVCIFNWRDLFLATGTDTSWVLYMICSQFKTFEQIRLCSSCCVWFVALLASPYAVLLRTCPYLFLAQFDSSAYIRIQFELHWPVQS